MLKGKTRHSVAFAAALLGTSFLVPANEAQASSQDSGILKEKTIKSDHHVKKHIVYKRNIRKRKHIKRKHHRHVNHHYRRHAAHHIKNTPVVNNAFQVSFLNNHRQDMLSHMPAVVDVQDNNRMAKFPILTALPDSDQSLDVAALPNIENIPNAEGPPNIEALPSFVKQANSNDIAPLVVAAAPSALPTFTQRGNNNYVSPQPKLVKQADSRGLSSRVPRTSRNHVVAKVDSQPQRCGFLNLSTDCETTTSSWFGRGAGSSILAKAETMVGMSARGDRKNLSQMFASTLQKVVDPVRTPWCAAWANAVLAKEGIKGTDSLIARSFLDWGTSTKTPDKGDVVVLARGRGAGHVGFFVERQEINGHRYVKVLGGNTSKSVQSAWFPESRVLGYRRAG